MSLRAQVLVCFLLVVSGATALVYQVTWVRDLSLIFGASSEATAIVLSSFMAGLALGSFTWGRRSASLARPLRVYGLLEIGVGLSALALPSLLDWLDSLYVGAAIRSGGVGPGLALARVVMAFGALVVPTFFMGGTLPVLVRGFVRRRAEVGVRLAWLYGLNTLGGVGGALAAGFVLVPRLGVWQTQVAAVALNLAIGVAAFVAGGRPQSTSPMDPAPAPGPDASPGPRPQGTIELLPWRLAFIGTAVSGMCALALEVMWTRGITVSVGSTSYSFTVMLASFLVGIWLGSWLHAAMPLRRLDSAAQFGAILALLGASSWAASQWIPRLPELVVRLNLDLFSDAQRVRPLTTLAVAFLVMLVPCVFMGAALPVAAQARARLQERLGSSVGDTLGLNTLGSIVGSLLAGFVLIPAIGLQRGMQLAAATSLAYGTIVLGSALFARAPRGRWLVAGATAGLAVSLVALSTLGRPWDRELLGGFHNNKLTKYVGRGGSVDLRPAFADASLAYYREGRGSLVSVVERRGQLGLMINGKAVASTNTVDMQLQLLLGHVPALLHPDPKSALVVGLGAGVSAGALAAHPEITTLRIAEIEPAVEGAARQFADANDRVLEDERVELVFHDGRNELKTTPRRFDIITSDPIHPWAYGAAYLFTAEYYELARQRLREGGIMCQWLPAYELASSDFQSVVATFAQSFPYVLLWQASIDVVLIGSDAPLRIDLRALTRRLAGPRVKRQLAAVGLDAPLSFLANLAMDDAAVRRYARGAVINTDDNLYLEFSAPRSIGASGFNNPLSASESRVGLLAMSDNVAPMFVSMSAAREAFQRHQWARAKTLEAQLSPQFGPGSEAGLRALRRVLEEVAGYAPARIALADSLLRLAAWQDAGLRPGPALSSAREARAVWPASGAAHRMEGLLLEKSGDLVASIPPLEAALRLRPKDWTIHGPLGMALLEAGRADDAARVLREGLALRPGNPALERQLRAVSDVDRASVSPGSR